MSAFSSLAAIATKIRRDFDIDGNKLNLFWFPVFRNKILLRYLHLAHHCSSILNQFGFYLALDIPPNMIHDLFTFFCQISLFCKPFGDVLADVPAAVLKKAIWHRNR